MNVPGKLDGQARKMEKGERDGGRSRGTGREWEGYREGGRGRGIGEKRLSTLVRPG